MVLGITLQQQWRQILIKMFANLSMGKESAHRELSNGGTLDENDQGMSN